MFQIPVLLMRAGFQRFTSTLKYLFCFEVGVQTTTINSVPTENSSYFYSIVYYIWFFINSFIEIIKEIIKIISFGSTFIYYSLSLIIIILFLFLIYSFFLIIFQFIRQKFILNKDSSNWNMKEYKDVPSLSANLLKQELLKINLENVTLTDIISLENKIKSQLGEIVEVSGKGWKSDEKKQMWFLEGRLAFMNHMIKNHLGLFKQTKELDITWVQDLTDALKYIELLKIKIGIMENEKRKKNRELELRKNLLEKKAMEKKIESLETQKSPELLIKKIKDIKS
jgi:hypothetical protein